MKKFLLIFIFIFVSTFCFNCAASNESINVYSWGEFISNGADGTINVNSKFTEETGIKVNYKTFQNNEELFAKISGGGADYDVIIPSDYMISRLIEKKYVGKNKF